MSPIQMGPLLQAIEAADVRLDCHHAPAQSRHWETIAGAVVGLLSSVAPGGLSKPKHISEGTQLSFLHGSGLEAWSQNEIGPPYERGLPWCFLWAGLFVLLVTSLPLLPQASLLLSGEEEEEDGPSLVLDLA